jgi:hypothetical protein
MPLPNTTGIGSGYSFNDLRINNYFDSDKFYNLILKFDWQFGDRDQVFVCHASDDRTENRAVNGTSAPVKAASSPSSGSTMPPSSTGSARSILACV